LGFRGEALYSISSISKVELITKTHADSHGIKLEMEGGSVKSFSQTAAVPGTNIKVRNLFFNTPVRYKFLKSDRVELGHITDIISRYIIAYPEINFKFMHNSKPIVSSPSSTDHLNAIFDIYGKKYAKGSMKFSLTHFLFSAEGYLGDPSLAQSTAQSSSVFINKRFVVSPTIQEAMKFGYKDYIMINKHPFYVIFLTMDPAKVDFNIHPTKKVVRFEQEEQILTELGSLIREKVNQNFGKETTTGQLEESVESPANTIEEYIEKRKYNQDKNPEISSPSDETGPQIPPTSNQEKSKKKSNTIPLPLDAVVPNLISKKSNSFSRSEWIRTKSFPKMRLISESGQLNNVYFVFEGQEGYYILDMHAADERINFEKEMKAYQKGGMKKQRLIIPFTIEISVNMKDFLMETIAEIEKFGFEMEYLGGKTFTLHTIPAILKEVTDTAMLTDICLEIIQIGKQSSFTHSVEKIIKYIACHESIRGGDIINDRDLPRKLLEQLSQCENPHHCAHGRPTMLFFSWKYLEKEFHR
jgi:DNA mismatch repair protein MutL